MLASSISSFVLFSPTVSCLGKSRAVFSMLHGELSGRNFPKKRMDQGSVSFIRRSSDENWEVGRQGRKLAGRPLGAG